MNPETKTRIPVAFLVPVFLGLIASVSMALAVWPLLFIVPTVGKMAWLALMPVVFLLAWTGVAAILSQPFQRAIIPGKFPRRVDHAVYGPRRLYGLCWGALYYFTPIYYAVFSVPTLRKFAMWSFGYRGHPDVNIAPDAWLRDLPLLKFSQGVYVANKATIGTNICMADGNILVDKVTLGRGAMIGHMTMVAPGCAFGDHTEIGVGSGIGIRVRIGNKTRIGPTTTINHGAQIGSDVDVGTMSYIGVKAKVADGIKLPSGSNISEGADLKTQEDVRKYISSETELLHAERTRLEAVYGRRVQTASGPEPVTPQPFELKKALSK